MIHDASSMLLGQHEAELIDTRRYWLVFGSTGSVWGGTGWYFVVSIEWYWLVLDGTRSLEGSTGWYLVVLGQYNLVLFGIKWYWADKGLLYLYILKKE